MKRKDDEEKKITELARAVVPRGQTIENLEYKHVITKRVF